MLQELNKKMRSLDLKLRSLDSTMKFLVVIYGALFGFMTGYLIYKLFVAHDYFFLFIYIIFMIGMYINLYFQKSIRCELALSACCFFKMIKGYEFR